GYVRVLKRLIEQEADLESTNEDGDSPLLLAVWHGHEAAVRVLLWHGLEASVELLGQLRNLAFPRDRDGRTALHVAALRINAEIVRMLVSAGADVAARDTQGVYP
ncbi:ankyrin repeat-containing domain protein, partial [Baffinella frigidus]